MVSASSLAGCPEERSENSHEHPHRWRVAVIGGGICGAAAARRLADTGVEVVLIDLGRAPGGRLSTRRVPRESNPRETLRFDVGAPCFTASSDRFLSQIGVWSKHGVVAPWFGRFLFLDEIGVGFERLAMRWVGVPGMSAIVGDLLADSDSAVGITRIERLHLMRAMRLVSAAPESASPFGPESAPSSELPSATPSASASASDRAFATARPSSAPRWLVDTVATDRPDARAMRLGPFDAVILAMPAPQAARIVQASTEVDSTLGTLVPSLASEQFEPAWVAMYAFALPIPIDASAIIIRHPGVLASIVHESGKPNGGHGGVDRWVVRSQAAWAKERLNAPPLDIAREMLAAFRSIVNGIWGAEEAGVPEPVVALAHRWTFALPIGIGRTNPRLARSPDGRVVACGDWSHGDGVEAAYLAGCDAAEAVLAVVEAMQRRSQTAR